MKQDTDEPANEYEADGLMTALRRLPAPLLKHYVYTLMLEGKITYHDLMDMHIKHLEAMRRGASKEYDKLSSMVVKMFCDTKKNYNSNLKEIMHYLRDRGCANVTHDEIDRK